MEENLDEDGEMSLCQHLGFQGSRDGGVNFGRARDGESVVAGDLVCYNTQSGGTSCCSYLQPKTATSTDKIPSVECEYILLCGLIIIVSPGRNFGNYNSVYFTENSAIFV